MGWADLLSTKEGISVPWTGGRHIQATGRTFKIKGRLPREFGWHLFSINGGRVATYAGDTLVDFDLISKYPRITGYLIGNRLIPDNFSRVPEDASNIIPHSIEVFLVDQSLEKFTRASVINYEQDKHVFVQQEFPLGPEVSVLEAYEDSLDSLQSIPNVIPALDLAFRFESRQRELAEQRALELQRQREEEERQRALTERRDALRQQVGSPEGRRELAQVDFPAAARAALAVTGAELISERQAHSAGERIVRFRFMRQRFECICNATTLRITDSGICLSGLSNDQMFTLESLPAVISEAIDRGLLHVYRHG